MKNIYKKIVIKVGTNVLTKENLTLDLQIIKNLVSQISELKQKGIEVVLISSGAVASGKATIKLSKKSTIITKRQVYSAIGQAKLVAMYGKLFAKYNYFCGQILVTKDDFRDRTHYLNIKNCLDGLLCNEVVPIVNENDTVSVTELMFTDNDELAGLISSMLGVDALIILTNVDGIFDGHPKEKNSKLIPIIDSSNVNDLNKYISPDKSLFGRGGMLTKSTIALKTANLGIPVHIVNGKQQNIVLDLLAGKKLGTKFVAKKTTSSLKRWIAHSEGREKGVIYINECAVKILSSKEQVVSLLPVGIVKIEGNFEKGDIVKISSESGQGIGYGMVNYSAKEAQEYLGQKDKKALISYDYMFIKNSLILFSCIK